jgi:hypothetical protein
MVVGAKPAYIYLRFASPKMRHNTCKKQVKNKPFL